MSDAAWQRFQSRRISGSDIPLVRYHMQLEVPPSLVVSGSHCQTWGGAYFLDRLSSIRSSSSFQVLSPWALVFFKLVSS